MLRAADPVFPAVAAEVLALAGACALRSLAGCVVATGTVCMLESLRECAVDGLGCS